MSWLKRHHRETTLTESGVELGASRFGATLGDAVNNEDAFVDWTSEAESALSNPHFRTIFIGFLRALTEHMRPEISG